MEKHPHLFVFAWVAAAYVVISFAVGDWLRTLIIFPAYALLWLFMLRQVFRQRRRA
jgi:membrane protein implicated in regulation of membrane protease activity